jgi:hypothetical protein
MTLGSQTWMEENLKYKVKYSRCGPDQGSLLTEEDTDICNTYGRLYSWAQANDNVCPSNWHIPSDDEWKKLKTFVPPHNYDFQLGGYGSHNYQFLSFDEEGHWWTSSENSSNDAVEYYYRKNINDVTKAVSIKYNYLSVRCVKGN